MSRDTLFSIVVLLAILAISSTFLIMQSYQASVTTVDNQDRREYTYCPLSDSDAKSINGEINGCPLARVYVHNWSKMSLLEQQNIDTLLRAKGFVDSGENILK